jgi:hypothetical protein
MIGPGHSFERIRNNAVITLIHLNYVLQQLRSDNSENLGIGKRVDVASHKLGSQILMLLKATRMSE